MFIIYENILYSLLFATAIFQYFNKHIIFNYIFNILCLLFMKIFCIHCFIYQCNYKNL